MKTRNEFIAATAAMFACARPTDPLGKVVADACNLTDEIELRAVAPWQTAPVSDTAAAVVAAAVAWQVEYSRAGVIEHAYATCRASLSAAVRAHLAAQGGGA